MTEFRLDGNRLVVIGSLDSDADDELRKWCVDLSLGDHKSVIVDLSGVNHVTSTCIGILVSLWIDLCAAKKGMKVVSSPAVDRLLHLGGLTTIFASIPADSEPEATGGVK